MDPNIGWYQPEQQGTALRQWEGIIDGLSDNHDHIPLSMAPQASIDSKYSFMKDKFKANRASTYALNRNPQLITGFCGTPWRKPDTKYPRGVVGLHKEIEDFVEYIRPTKNEHQIRQKVVTRIKDVVRQLWPRAQCEVFGSFSTGLYLPTSDIDLVILGEWDTLPMFTLQKALIQAGVSTASAIKVLDKASVPIVKLTEQSTQVKVDISFNQRNGVKSAKLIREFCKKFPPLPKLAFVLKQFLLQRDLNEVFTGGISSYSLILLIVSFLQLHPRQKEVKASESSVNLGVLLIEFFETYGCYFNYADVGIRIKGDGALLPKEQLQVEMAMALGQGSPGNIMIDTSSILCIEDPLTAGNDIGRSSYGALNVKKAFCYAFTTLEQAVHPSLQSSIDPKHTILGRVIRITDVVIDYRTWLDATFSQNLRPRAASSLEELNDSPDEFDLNQRLPRPHRDHREGFIHHNGNNPYRNGHMTNNNQHHQPHHTHHGRYPANNGTESWDKRTIGGYHTTQNGESCSSSLSSLGSDKGSSVDEEGDASRSENDSDIDESQLKQPQHHHRSQQNVPHIQHVPMNQPQTLIVNQPVTYLNPNGYTVNGNGRRRRDIRNSQKADNRVKRS